MGLCLSLLTEKLGSPPRAPPTGAKKSFLRHDVSSVPVLLCPSFQPSALMRARYIFCLRFFVVDNLLIPRRTYIVGAHARTCMMSSILFLETRYAVRRTSRCSLGNVASSSHVHTKRIEQTSFRPLIKNATAASPTRNTYCSRRGCFPTEEEKKLENGYIVVQIHIALISPENSAHFRRHNKIRGDDALSTPKTNRYVLQRPKKQSRRSSHGV